MFLPYRSKNPPESLPIATCALILVNTIVYVFTSDHGAQIKLEVLQKWGISAVNFSPTTIFSSMFLHAGPLHLIGNMFFLYLLGFAVEGRLKTPKFLLLYFLAGAGGDALHHVLIGIHHPTMPSIGASGAIMGVMGAALWMFPYAKVATFYWIWFWRGLFDCPMWGICLYFLGFDALEAMLFGGMDSIGHFAHLGGAAAGLLICMLFRPKRDGIEVAEAKSTLADVKDHAVLSRRDLEHMHRVQPDNDVVLLHWMQRSIRDMKVEPQCQSAFVQALPRLLRESEPLPVATCVLHLGQTPGLIRPAIIIELAGLVEKARDPGMTIRLCEMAYGQPGVTEAEQEACLFRVAMVSESYYQNYGRATACYKQIVHRWPMSPMADQARARLQVCEPRAAVAP